jgi:S-(hydroxymethyl)glutathione dehydrogenase / alcohol dehydrogenase
MRAAIYHGAHQPLTVETVDMDEPRPHEVVVRTMGSGVCHSDYHYLDGSHPMVTPAVLGHEAAGIVERVGSAVTRIALNDHVIVCFNAWCGQCEQCLLGHPNQCTDRPLRRLDDTPQLSWKGQRLGGSVSQINAFAERMLLHERQVARIADEIPLDVAALIGCGVLTGVGAVFNTAQVRPLSTVAVFGLGGVGLSVIQGAYIAGARRIVAVDPLDERLEMARRFGATHAVNASSEDPIDAVVAICGDGGADFSFDAAPDSASSTYQCVEVLKPRGVATIIGGNNEGLRAVNIRTGERSIRGCLMGSNRLALDIPHLVDLYLAGRLKLDEMIGRRGDLGDLNDLFDDMGKGIPGRGVVVFS